MGWKQRWVTPKARSSESKIQGVGVVAVRPIKKGETVGVLGGVIVPKKDVRDIGSLSAEDEGYLTDVFLVTRHLIEQEHLRDYRFYTNGPGPQAVAYLHFHLLAKRPTR